MTPSLHIHGLDALNAAPLQWDLGDVREVAGRRLRLTLGTPAAVSAAMTAGTADVALLPSIELQRIPDLTVVPGICVAARRRVRSVLLLARRAPESLASVAVDDTSRTSVALLRILLARRFGARPRFVHRPPDPEAMLREHDAALLIADVALRAAIPGVEVLDLAELWSEWTALPFVFAVWAVRPGVDLPAVTELLARSRAAGMRDLPHLVARHAARDGNPEGPSLMSYLGELLHYNLGPEEERSLARFFHEAHSLGLIAEPRPLRIGRYPGTRDRALVGGNP